MTVSRLRRVKRSTLNETRQLFVAALERGVDPVTAGRVLGIGRSTAFKWAAMAAAGESMVAKKAPGGASRLTQEQVARIKAWLVGSNPRQLQFDFALWTRKIVAELIEREFGVSYTPQRVGELLRAWGFSPQRPLRRAYEQDPHAVHLWRTERFPQLQRAAKKAGARIYFADEASVRTDFHSGTTWAPVGRTPIVRRTGNRSSVTMISAVAATGDMHFAILDGNATSERFIGFCRQLLTDIDRPIYLVVDGHSCHTSTATKTFVESTNGRLTLWYLHGHENLRRVHQRPPHPVVPASLLPGTEPRRMGVEERQTRPHRQVRALRPQRPVRPRRQRPATPQRHTRTRPRLLRRSRPGLHQRMNNPRSPLASILLGRDVR
jgi:transposase